LEDNKKSKVKAQVKVENQLRIGLRIYLKIMKYLNLNLSLSLMFYGGVDGKADPLRQNRPRKNGRCQ
jgi:hypothetical protein